MDIRKSVIMKETIEADGSVAQLLVRRKLR